MSGRINLTVRDAGYLGVSHSASTVGMGERLGADTNVGKVARLLREQHHELRILSAQIVTS
jgi:hypothetical protein